MKTTIQIRFLLILGCVMLSVFSLSAQSETEVNVGRVAQGEVDFAGFKLSQDATININGSGASYDKWGSNLIYYGWIIESKSREVVWSLLDEYENDFFQGNGSFSFEANIELEKGAYEVYYTGIRDNSNYKYYGNDLTKIVKEVVNAIVDDKDHSYYKNEKDYMTIGSNDNGFTVNDGREYVDNISKKSIASFVRTGDDEAEQKNFALKKETKVYIYCQGEKEDKEIYDFAWIYNLKTHEKIWPNNLTDFNRAGGGRKNFSAFQELTLPAGEYQINYVTDGSHSFERWNVKPPHDPQFWGVSMWCDNKDMKNVSENTSEHLPVVNLTEVRDDEFVTQGFEITKSIDLRVICLGESMDHEPSDYGWIIDAKSGTTVWKFTRSKSEYAGGSDKNRIINELVTLEKGKYIAYYVTDGSHAYHDWNSAPPHDQKLWGLSLWTVNDTDKSSIKLFKVEEFKDENVIAGITGVRDNQKDYENFKLEKESKVRIYAIGEGDDGYMSDTGWIKNMETGKTVWEMTYRTTEHAGGAHKNRMYNDYILLPAGNYRLYFESDGSHSFMDWNADPPHDPMNYGIKILKE
ncbi:MAG: hypothetical protein GQ564_06890 [Bacteroidales bacterium]|nr:hypothetical protein [Bacteroidales bacterium]